MPNEARADHGRGQRCRAAGRRLLRFRGQPIGGGQKEAQDQCAPNTRATRTETDWKLDFCPLLLPARATFVCQPKK